MYNPNLYYPYNYGTPYAPQYVQAQQLQNTMVSNFGNNTNIIYVNGIDDVKNRQQPTIQRVSVMPTLTKWLLWRKNGYATPTVS